MNSRPDAERFPLIRHERPDSIIAYRDGRPIDAAQFLADVQALAERLPDRRHVVNRAGDRYHFAVGLAAALVRGQLMLLPSNDTAETLRQLCAQYGDVYCLSDEPLAGIPMDQVLYAPPSAAKGAAFSVPSFDASQIAALLFTSGSTGQPVPQPRSWGALVRSVRCAGDSIGVAQFPGAAIVSTLSPQHSYGLESSVMLALQHGLALTPSRSFYPADVQQQLEMPPRPILLVTTPIHLRFLTAEAMTFPALDLLVCATAPLSARLAADAEACFSAPLMEIYGCAEAGQIAFRRPTRDTQWRCFQGITLSQDEQGSWAQGNQVDRKTLLHDVLELGEAGLFTLQGRNADVVNIAGKRTSLAYLNHHLNDIDGVEDGAFFVQQDTGDDAARLTALVVAPGLTADAIRKALRQRIDPIFSPRPLHMVEALPRNANGKVTRQAVDAFLATLARPSPAPHAEVVFSQTEAFVAGHFPGNPIVPGAALLQEVLRHLEEGGGLTAGPFEIRAAKFLRPVRPGDSMQIKWRAHDGGYQFECLVRDAAVLTGIVGRER